MTILAYGKSQEAFPEVVGLLRAGDARLVSVFGSTGDDGSNCIHYLLDVNHRGYQMFSASADRPVPSLTPIAPAAAWYEREMFDQYGIESEGHPDPRPLLVHENWPKNIHPGAAEVTQVPWANEEYSFLEVQGEGVCEVPVGPVHAGIIEPGHFHFSVVGDTVLHLELRHFYTHKGTEKLFEKTPVMNGAMIAESVSGDNCFAHAIAYCQAIEEAYGVTVPPKAQALRLIGLELERMMAHIADVGALCGDVGFTVPAAYTSRIKEAMLRASGRFFGTRFWRGIAVPGGVACDLGEESARELSRIIASIAEDFARVAHIILGTPSVQNRFETTGVLSRQAALSLGVVGPPARASGVRLDVRTDHPYGRYREIKMAVPEYGYGDVMARARIRIDETAISARIACNALDQLPCGPVCIPVPGFPNREGMSAVESPRGELLYWIKVRDGKIVRCHIKSPSFQNWLALPQAMPGNIIADFPLINKSFNLSYSGCDR